MGQIFVTLSEYLNFICIMYLQEEEKGHFDIPRALFGILGT